ncbi:kinetochore protein Spc25 [Caerostris darwini]|uniref:Kinetochore protein SPC25 n=1 Tax=Caerostris darwini TaxID=1538125 RepID=A0AAV4SCW4_9ARAC|nr:kinetochore protein Spc25 [Caerostris darwini]
MLKQRIEKLKETNGFKFDLNKIKNFEAKCEVDNRIQDIKNEYIGFIEKTLSEYLVVSQLKNEIEILQQKHKKTSSNLHEMVKRLERKKAAVLILEKQNFLLNKFYDFYKENLGFEMKRLKGGGNEEQSEILFSFNHINKNKPLDTFTFILVLNGKTYSVKDCSAHIQEMDKLLAKLNKTDDLSNFVIQTRKNFCSIAGTT